MGSISGLGRSPGEGKGYPLQNSMDCIVHGVSKSRTRLSDFYFHFESPGTQSLSGSLIESYTTSCSDLTRNLGSFVEQRPDGALWSGHLEWPVLFTDP